MEKRQERRTSNAECRSRGRARRAGPPVDAECRDPAWRSRYYSPVSGAQTTISRGVSGIHRIVWATLALFIVVTSAGSAAAQPAAMPPPPEVGKAPPAKLAPVVALRLFPL